jgi:AraC-like DNA-binding protein
MGDPGDKRRGALPTASGGIARLAYAHVRAAGGDPVLLLNKAGLTAAQIDDRDARLNVRDQIHFLNLAADALQDDLLGFHLAQAAELRELGLLYYVLTSSDSLGEALRRSARYSSIVNEGVSLKYEHGRDIRIALCHVGVSRHLDRHQMEFFAVTLVRIGRLLTGHRLVPKRVKFVHHRSELSPELSEWFGTKVEFGAVADEIVFAAPMVSIPVVSADPYLSQLLVKYCEEALAFRSNRTGSFRVAVENAIGALLPHGTARAPEIARQLGVTQRTLGRRLSSEGITFSEVLENLKSDLARRHLADKSLSISQIAWLLGYQEVSAFTHAFKRWTGKTPREARSQP